MLKKLLKKWNEKRELLKKTSAKAPAKPQAQEVPLKVQKKQEKIEKKLSRKRQVVSYFEKAGIAIPPDVLEKKVFHSVIGIMLLSSAYLLYFYASWGGASLGTIAYAMLCLWVFGFASLLGATWILFYVWIDVRIFKRRIEIEEILPDFLLLASSNIKAGMTIDRALWYSVRPNFGVLAREIEIVAKETIAGEDLKAALMKFAEKYDSKILQRSISLIIEGIESGGEIGDLLVKVATNIEDQKIMVKEMSANVTTYVIFITFSAIVAAPGLFALSGVLIDVLHSISASLEGSGMDASSRVGITFSGSGIELGDFKVFAFISLSITAMFSAMIVSMIKKGNVKEGAHNIPIFLIISLTLYMIASYAAESVIGLFFKGL
jgi:Flp pilus assembly protein TadB